MKLIIILGLTLFSFSTFAQKPEVQIAKSPQPLSASSPPISSVTTPETTITSIIENQSKRLFRDEKWIN